MSRSRLPALRATPLRPVFGSAAETRSAKIWAKRSAKAADRNYLFGLDNYVYLGGGQVQLTR